MEDKKTSKILLCEDDSNLGLVLKNYLELNDYEVTLERDGRLGLAAFQREKFDLCLLDVMMPHVDGFTLAEEIRDIDPDVPLFFLSAKTLMEDIITGYKLGADDYITKPIKPKLLVSKVKALLRRLKSDDQTTETLNVGGIEINREEYKIIKEGKEIILPRKEFELFYLLASKPGKVFKREEILDKVWGNEVIVGGRTIDVHIRKLREKIGEDLFKTIKGVGYKLEV